MNKYLLPFFFICTIAMMLVMGKTGAVLKTDTTPLGILNLEFAYNSTKTHEVINAWSQTLNETSGKVPAAELNTYLDFIFIFFYSGFLFLTCTYMAHIIKGSAAKAGLLIAKAALLAGFLDVLENTGMLLTLSGHVSDTIAFLTTFVSIIKWSLAVIAVLYILTGLLALAYRKLR